MTTQVRLDTRYTPSQDVVAREIEGEMIIVPLTAGIGDMEDELFTLNETGRAIWNRLDGRKTLKDIVSDLCAEFDAPATEITQDVTGFTAELLKRRMLVEVSD
jgi:hypothetical protein